MNTFNNVQSSYISGNELHESVQQMKMVAKKIMYILVIFIRRENNTKKVSKIFSNTLIYYYICTQILVKEIDRSYTRKL